MSPARRKRKAKRSTSKKASARKRRKKVARRGTTGKRGGGRGRATGRGAKKTGRKKAGKKKGARKTGKKTGKKGGKKTPRRPAAKKGRQHVVVISGGRVDQDPRVHAGDKIEWHNTDAVAYDLKFTISPFVGGATDIHVPENGTSRSHTVAAVNARGFDYSGVDGQGPPDPPEVVVN